MKFAAVTGYTVGTQEDPVMPQDLFNLIFKQIVYQGIVYTKDDVSLLQDILDENLGLQFDDFGNSFNVFDSYQLQDDLVYIGSTISYKNNLNISIEDVNIDGRGDVMIYMFYVVTPDELQVDDDNTLLDLIEWKDKLIAEGRLSENTKFASIIGRLP